LNQAAIQAGKDRKKAGSLEPAFFIWLLPGGAIGAPVLPIRAP
jgi:hypothetical protein